MPWPPCLWSIIIVNHHNITVGRGVCAGILIDGLGVVGLHTEGGAGKEKELVHKVPGVFTNVGVDVLIELIAVDREALDETHDQLQHKGHLHSTHTTKFNNSTD